MEPEILQWLVGGGAGGGGLAVGMVLQQLIFSRRNGSGASLIELQVRMKGVEDRLASQESKLDRVLENWRSHS